MRTLVCLEPKKMEFTERPQPKPQPNEALLKIKTVGICGTDIHAWAGNQPFFSYPRVLGHEICGVISEIGSGVKTLKVGQQVAVMPYLSCGSCGACQSGRTNCCENISVIGVHQDGGFCEYLNVPESNLIAVDGVDPVAAALIEPFAISAHAVRRAAVKANDQVLIVGAGPIGLGAAAIAKADGAQVVVADTSPERRKHVEKELGVTVLDAADANFEQHLREAFDGKLAQTVIDATGNQRAMNNAVNLIRHGGTIVFVGLFKGDLTFFDPDFHKKETTMMGSRNATLEDFEKVGRLMSEGKLAAAMMLSHTFPFDDLDARYEQAVINNKALLKGVIEF